MSKSILVVSGLGNCVGTGAATARLFAAKLGYRVALLSRTRKEVEALKTSINAAGNGCAEVFSLINYDHESIKGVFANIKKKWPDGRLKAAVWNTGQWSMIPFMNITEKDIKLSVQVNIVAATAFAQEAIAAFMATPREGETTGGTLIMTGATSAWRGSHSFGAFAAGKHGLRAISQSIAREYGPQGVHVAFVVIDGVIITERTLAVFGEGDPEDRLHTEGAHLKPDNIAATYLHLHQQPPDCWTLEMDLRPSKEKF